MRTKWLLAMTLLGIALVGCSDGAPEDTGPSEAEAARLAEARRAEAAAKELARRKLAEATQTVKDLLATREALEADVKRIGAMRSRVGAIEAWAAGGTDWLDHLAKLSAAFPPAADAFLVSLTTSGADTIRLSLRSRSTDVIEQFSTGLAGAGVGLTLAVDHTGLLYALVPLALAGLVAMAVPLRRIPLRLAVLTLPLLLSWFGARLLTPASMPTLEDKALLFTMDNVGHPVPRPQQPGYNWGRSGPLGMTRALWTLARLSREEPDPEAPLVKARRLAPAPARAAQVVPWIPVALVALLLAGVALRRRPWELAGQAALLLPFAALLWTAANTQALPKYLMAPMLPLPVLLGVAWAWLAHRRREDAREKAGGPLRRLAAPAVTAAVLTLMVTGAVPGWLAPDASRRLAMSTDPSFYQVYTHDPEDRSARLEACFRLFQADQRRGVPARSRLFPRDRFRRRWLAIHGEKQPAGQPCQP